MLPLGGPTRRGAASAMPNGGLSELIDRQLAAEGRLPLVAEEEAFPGHKGAGSAPAPGEARRGRTAALLLAGVLGVALLGAGFRRGGPARSKDRPDLAPLLPHMRPLPLARGAAAAAGFAVERPACAGLIRGGRPWVHWHISKAAGTSMCHDARHLERTVPKHEGCHPPKPDGNPGRPPWSGGHEMQMTESAYAYAFDELGLTYISPESQMPAFGPARSYGPAPAMSVYHTIALREPKTRMVSWYQQTVVHKGAKKGDDWMTFDMGNGNLLGLDHEPSLAEWLPRRFRDGGDDNFQIRYILGLKHDPDTVIGERHLEAAKRRLREDVDAVLIAERLGETGCLREAAGWPAEAARKNVKLSADHDRAAAPPVPGDEAYVAAYVGEAYPEVKELLDELNVFDLRLYAYAIELFEEQLSLCEGCRARPGARRSA